MLKSLFKSLGVSVAVAVPGILLAQDPTMITVDGNDLYFTLDETNHTATFVKRPKEGRVTKTYEFTEFTVPTKVAYNSVDYDVVLSEGALANANNLTTLVIPEGFTAIPDRFASPCPALTSVSLPSTLKTIGTASDAFNHRPHQGAFSSTAITEIEIPAGVEIIGDNTFNYCRSLTKVTFHEGLKVIGTDGFSECSMLESVNLPESMERLNRHVFSNCTKLARIYLPDGITFIGNRAFRDTGIEEIALPASLKVIRSQIVYNDNIKTLTIPAGVERVNPAGLQTACLDSLIIADSDKTLEFDLLADNKYGRDPWVGDSQETAAVGYWLRNTVTYLYVGRNTATWVHPDYVFPDVSRADDNESTTNPFYSLKNMKEITVGSDVTDASQLAFENYPALESITFLSPEPPVMQPLTPEQAATVKVIVPEGAVDSYKAVEGWSGVTDFIESGIENIIADDSDLKVEYFNLRGEKVANPSGGLFIKRQGSKATKVIL